jgi:aldehyde:ferredoxin oxidoreductase
MADKIFRVNMSDLSSKVEITNPEEFKTANRTFAKALVDNPISTALGQYGTNVLVNIINEAGGLPTRNFTSGQFEAMRKYREKPCTTLLSNEVANQNITAIRVA